MSAPYSRDALLARLAATPSWDVLVIGGGATGLGCALDAAARGYSVLLVEARDFAAGTSSRSTKLIHGGVRYLAQGRFSLVREALRERGHLLRNAPALVRPLRFVVPARGRLDRLRLRVGLGLYDRLAGGLRIAPCEGLEPAALGAMMPGVLTPGAGGVAYWDAQFDDAALALSLARSASQHGALVLNHCRADGLLQAGGRVCGAVLAERASGRSFEVLARVVVNATGVWGDAVRRMADPRAHTLLQPSQGVHLVVDAAFLPGLDALLVPHTDDGRVLFMIPWQGKLLIGTTDTPRDDVAEEPAPLAGEVEGLLAAAGRWLVRAPGMADVRSVFAGLRPLLGGSSAEASSRISREHRVEVSARGLVSVLGGKWTTYRSMAEQAIDCAEAVAGLAHRASSTATLGLDCDMPWGCTAPHDAALLPGGQHAGLLPGVDAVRHAVREGFALDVEDVLARRSRVLFLDAAAAQAAAAPVADILAAELGWSAERRAESLAAFHALAGRYRSGSCTQASSPP